MAAVLSCCQNANSFLIIWLLACSIYTLIFFFFSITNFPLFLTLATFWRLHFIVKQKKTTSQNRTVFFSVFLDLSGSSLTLLPATTNICSLEPLSSTEDSFDHNFKFLFLRLSFYKFHEIILLGAFFF